MDDIQGMERFPMNLIEGTRSAWAAACRRALVANILAVCEGAWARRLCGRRKSVVGSACYRVRKWTGVCIGNHKLRWSIQCC